MKNAIVFGAAGFLGAVLTEALVSRGIHVYGVIRKGSPHNERIEHLSNVTLIYSGANEYGGIEDLTEGADVCFYLTWGGGRYDYNSQIPNITALLAAMDKVKQSGCGKIIITGSQAELGAVPPDIIETEDLPLNPVTAYGSAKAAAPYLSREKAKSLGMEWIWARVYSLIGKYEPHGRMLPDFVENVKNDRVTSLTTCTQNWDYMDVEDAAGALISLAEAGQTGNIYNIANGNYRKLSEFIYEVLDTFHKPETLVNIGTVPNPGISLQPSVSKIKDHTGFEPRISFHESILKMR